MPLDFHLAKNEKEAPLQEVVAEFGYQAHALVFHRLGLPDGEFPLFNRMSDYFSDATYDLNEIPQLVVELATLKHHFNSNVQLLKQLESIDAACTLALKNGCSIWIYCD